MPKEEHEETILVIAGLLALGDVIKHGLPQTPEVANALAKNAMMNARALVKQGEKK